MKKRIPRNPYNYDGTRITTHKITDLLSAVLHNVGVMQQERPDLVLAAWSDVIGPQLASMTQAVSFTNGVLVVKVKNSSLYSLLSRNDKPRILENLRKKFPQQKINTIFFRMG